MQRGKREAVGSVLVCASTLQPLGAVGSAVMTQDPGPDPPSGLLRSRQGVSPPSRYRNAPGSLASAYRARAASTPLQSNDGTSAGLCEHGHVALLSPPLAVAGTCTCTPPGRRRFSRVPARVVRQEHAWRCAPLQRLAGTMSGSRRLVRPALRPPHTPALVPHTRAGRGQAMAWPMRHG